MVLKSNTLYFIALSFIYVVTNSACTSRTKTKEELILEYLSTIDNQFFPSDSNVVVIMSSTNSCSVCLNEISELRKLLTSSKIRFIYSVEHTGLLDKSLMKTKEKSVFFDYYNTPFKKGFVSANPMVYFVSNMKVIREMELNGVALEEFRSEVERFVSQ